MAKGVTLYFSEERGINKILGGRGDSARERAINLILNGQ